MQRRLYKNDQEKMISGVCSGIGEFFGIDPTIVRVVWGILFLVYGLSFWVYLLLAIVLPSKSQVMGQSGRTQEQGRPVYHPPGQDQGFDTTQAQDAPYHKAGEHYEHEVYHDPAEYSEHKGTGNEGDNIRGDGKQSASHAADDEEAMWRESRKNEDEEY